MISPPDCNPAARHGNAGSLPQEERTAVIAVESGNDGGCLGLPSFRGASETRTRNLEIPRCAIAHLRPGPSGHPGMTSFKLVGALPLRLQLFGCQRREVGEDAVGAGALERQKAFHHRPLAVNPAVAGGG